MFPEGDISVAQRLSELWRNDSGATGKRTLGREAHTTSNLEEVADYLSDQDISWMQPLQG
ncbi:MAG: hypothetical protein LUF04_01655 [Bacteroides sp.]|nr:hypothetical protein [Bacteroides sp.]